MLGMPPWAFGAVGGGMRDDDAGEREWIHPCQEELLGRTAAAVHEDGVALTDEDEGCRVAVPPGDGPRATEKDEVHGVRRRRGRGAGAAGHPRARTPRRGWRARPPTRRGS